MVFGTPLNTISFLIPTAQRCINQLDTLLKKAIGLSTPSNSSIWQSATLLQVPRWQETLVGCFEQHKPCLRNFAWESTAKVTIKARDITFALGAFVYSFY
jgi:hypothetical protein